MRDCMDEHKNLDERPHRQRHSSEIYYKTVLGRNNSMIGGHKAGTWIFCDRGTRAEHYGQKEQKGIKSIMPSHQIDSLWGYEFGSLLVCRTNYVWIEQHINGKARDNQDYKL
eukprot:2191401-Heterocapsa_arctica.AAC.1